MAKQALPAVGDLVELWFSGYDEYYPGTVKALDPPDSFTVFLDDGTTWPVDRVNNIWRHTAPASTAAPPADSAPVDAVDDAPAPAPSTTPPPHDPTPTDDIDDTRAPLQSSTPTAAPPTTSSPPTPASQPPRRKSGKAFRKSTGGPQTSPSRLANTKPAPPVSGPSTSDPSPSAAHRSPAQTKPAPLPARVTRQRRTQEQDILSESPPVRSVRRGRPPASAQKRQAPDTPTSVRWDDATEKRRKGSDGTDVANGLAPAPVVERVTRSGSRKDEVSVEKLSTKAVTAIAVEAALASAKAVFKPLSDQLITLRTDLESISETAKRAAEEIPVELGRKKRGKGGSGPISASADALQLDLSELLGGGEARIRAYASLSDKEFESFHKLIEDQRKGLQQLDRILAAAKDLGKKAEKNAARDARAGRSRSRRG